MLNKVRKLPSLYRYFGLSWLLFRASYAARLKTGWMARQMPPYPWTDRPLAYWLREGVPSQPEAYVAWRQANGGRFFFDTLPDEFPNTINQAQIIAQADAILAGRWPYFSRQSFAVGFPPDWHHNPATGQSVIADRHWSQISDFGQGDIKLIWEASRFSVVYTLVRAYAVSHDERYPAAFWQLIEDWAAHNPPMLGPNWKCGQETTFRLMAWCFGLYGFASSAHSSPERVAQFAAMIAAQAERIAGNIAYARSQKNNHGISEAVGLWTVGLLFPEFSQAATWRAEGQAELEAEMQRQVYADGAYVQHSFNYQRVMLHDCLWALRLGEINQQRLPDTIYDRFARSLAFLRPLVDPQNGWVPNYGANDGALILPLNTCDFNDFRPVVQAGHYLLNQRRLYATGAWDEDLRWLFGSGVMAVEQDRSQHEPALNAEHSGYYTLHGEDSYIMVRCAPYQDRPSQSDQLHVDLWWRGINIAADAGTYLYNGTPPWNNGLARTQVHNTVVVDGQDQMTRAGLFLWLDWAQGQVTRREDVGRAQIWEGEHSGYQRLGVRHKRGIIRLVDDAWLIYDWLDSTSKHDYRLHWLLPDMRYQWNAATSQLQLQTPFGDYHVQLFATSPAQAGLVRAADDNVQGWISRYYGCKDPALSLTMQAETEQVCFMTVFSPQPVTAIQNADEGQIEAPGWYATTNPSPEPGIRVTMRGSSADTLKVVF